MNLHPSTPPADRIAAAGVLFYAVAISPAAPLAAALCLILSAHAMTTRPALGCFVLALIVCYLYLLYALVMRETTSLWLDLSLLAVVSALAFRCRLAFDELSRRQVMAWRRDSTEAPALLPSGAGLDAKGSREISRARRRRGTFSVLLIDAGRSGASGTGTGTREMGSLAQELACALHGHLRPHDLLGACEAGGLLVLLPDTGTAGAERAADRLLAALRAAAHRQGVEKGNLAVQIGVAELDDTTRDFRELVRHAEVALCTAQVRGRERVLSWTRLHGRDGRPGHYRCQLNA